MRDYRNARLCQLSVKIFLRTKRTVFGLFRLNFPSAETLASPPYGLNMKGAELLLRTKRFKNAKKPVSAMLRQDQISQSVVAVLSCASANCCAPVLAHNTCA